MTNEAFMSLEINDILFKNILDNLYSNIHLAIVRELCCNAADSHRVARNPEPFLVQRPSEDSPLIIRDFGTGLSKSDVFLYLNKLMSGTKKDESDLTGTYGLGSKVVLALVDQYSIYSYFEGVCYEFEFKRENKGVPLLSCISETPTEERNGLKYVINFNNADAHRIDLSLNILKYFRIKPKILQDLNDLDSELEYFKEEKLQHLTSNIYITRDVDISSRSPVLIRLGDILYPIGPAVQVDNREILFSITNYNSYGLPRASIILDIEVDIVELPMNRENILHSTHNNQVLKEAYQAALQDSNTYFLNIINEELGTNYFSLENLSNNSVLDILRAGKVLSDKFNVDVCEELVRKCACFFNSTSSYTTLPFQGDLEGYSYSSGSIYSKQTNRVVSRLNIGNRKHIVGKDVVIYPIIHDIIGNTSKSRVRNFIASEAETVHYIGFDFYRYNEELTDTIKQKIIEFYLESLRVFTDEEVKLISSEELLELSEIHYKAVAKEKRRQARLIKDDSESVKPLIGIRTIIPQRLMSYYNNAIQSISSNAILGIKNEEGKLVTFDSSYFPNSRKFLVLPNKGNIPSNSISRHHLFDTIIVASPTKFDLVLNSLKLNPDIEIYTLDTLNTYPLLSEEELENFSPSIQKQLLTISIYKYLNKHIDLMDPDLLDSLLEKLEEVSGDKLLIDSLTDSQVKLTREYALSISTDYELVDKYTKYFNSVDKTKYDTLVQSVFTKEFLITNKDNILPLVTDPTILKNFINILLAQD